MNEKNELIRLTLRNLELVESACKILEDADIHFLGQLDKFMKTKLEKIFPNLVNHCKFKDEEDLSFWSENWILPDEEGYAFYSIDLISDDDLWWMTCFGGNLNGSMGIGFHVDDTIRNYLYNNSHTDLKKGKWWNSKLLEFYQQNDNEVKLK